MREDADFGNMEMETESEMAFANYCAVDGGCKRLVGIIESQRQELENAGQGIPDLVGLSASLNAKVEQLAEIRERILDACQAFGVLGAASGDIVQKARESFRKGDFHMATETLSDQAIREAVANEPDLKSRNRRAGQLHVLKARLSMADSFNLLGYINTSLNYEKALEYDPDPDTMIAFAVFLCNIPADFDTAEELCAKALGAYREKNSVAGQDFRPDIARAAGRLGEMHALCNHKEQALEGFREAYEIYRDLARQDPLAWTLPAVLTMANIASVHSQAGEFEPALSECQEAMDLARDSHLNESASNESASNDQPGGVHEIHEMLREAIARSLYLMAGLHRNLGEFGSALSEYREAEAIFGELARPGTACNPELALVLTSIAKLHSDMGDAQTALEELNSLLPAYRELAKENPMKHGPSLARALSGLSTLHAQEGELPAALAECQEELDWYLALARWDPEAFNPSLLNAYKKLAGLHAAISQPVSALADYEQALDLVRDSEPTQAADILDEMAKLHKSLGDAKSALDEYGQELGLLRESKPSDAASILNEMAMLHENAGEYGLALSEYGQAIETYQALAKDNPALHRDDLAVALSNRADLHEDRDDMDSALLDYAQALGIYRDLASQDPDRHNPHLAETLASLGRIHNKGEDVQTALNEYGEALAIYRQMSKETSDIPGIYAIDIASMLEIMAVIHADNGELRLALAEFKEALSAFRRLARSNPKEFMPDIAQVLKIMATLNEQAGKRDDARRLRQEATRTMEDYAIKYPD